MSPLGALRVRPQERLNSGGFSVGPTSDWIKMLTPPGPPDPRESISLEVNETLANVGNKYYRISRISTKISILI